MISVDFSCAWAKHILFTGCAYALCWSMTGHANDGTASNKNTTQSRTTLNTASEAAAAAAMAASAAAEAAASAAKAANAAIEAIQSLLPPGQRVTATTPAANQSTAAPVTHPTEVRETPSGNPSEQTQPVFPLQSASNTGKVDVLAAPSEHSLYGLVGILEVPVLTDARGEFSQGLAKIENTLDPLTNVSAMDLNDALSMAMGFSREVLIAQYRQEQATAQAGQAKAVLLPSLNFYVRTGRETSSPGVLIDPATGQAVTSDRHSRSDRISTFKQPLFDFGGFYEWKRRKVVEEARAESKRASRGDTYIATINAYLNLTSTKLLTNLAAEYEVQTQELYQYVEKRSKAGAANNSDKERVRARVLSIQASKVEQEGAHAAAGVEFARVVNATPTSLKLPTIEEVALTALPKALDQAMDLALKNNPEITALQKELAAGDLDKTVAKGRFLPKLDFEVSNTSIMNAGGANNTQNDERVMLVMNWNAFNGGGDMKFYEEKMARRNELVYRLDDQRRKVLQNLSAQYATLQAIRQRLEQGYQELTSINSAAQSMSKRMLSGNQSLLDLLDVYDRNYQARVRLVNLHMQEMTATAQIARLVQGDPSDAMPLFERNNQP